MRKMSLFDKLGVLFEVSKTSKLYILVIIALIILGIGLFLTKPKNKSNHKTIFIMVTIFITLFVIFSYHDSLGKMFSYMMNNFFVAIYFPTLAIYFAALIATNIILWISIFNFKSSRIIRIVNIVVYIIMTYVLLLLLNVVNTNKIDIFNHEAIYSNDKASALISLSSLLFIVWIIFLIVYKLILIYLKKDYKPKVRKIIVKHKVKKFPENYEPTIFPEYIFGSVPHKGTIVFNKELKDMESNFTLDDYKLFSKILKEQKEKVKEEKIKVEEPIDEIEDYTFDEERQVDHFREEQKREIIRMEEERRRLLEEEKLHEKRIRQERAREQKKYTELEMLYR